MPAAVHELKQIPFGHLIGAPMTAAIEAQAQAAQKTVEFIEKVGFKSNEADSVTGRGWLFTKPNESLSKDDGGEVRNVSFSYTKTDEEGQEEEFTMTVPILSIVPIPYIRIDEMTIDFKAKLTDAVQHDRQTSLSVGVEAKGSFDAWYSPVSMSFRVSKTFNTKSASSASRRREYSVDVHVRAVQDEMPGGLEKVLDMLEDAATAKKSDSS